MEEIYKKLTNKLDKSQICINEPMCKHTTFKIGGLADFFVKINNIEELKFVIYTAKKNEIPVTILGNGSNVLVKDRRN